MRVPPPPTHVLLGLAKLAQGAAADTLSPLDEWPEPWHTIGQRTARSNGQRHNVLREQLEQAVGQDADAVAQMIFAADAEETTSSAEEPWELPIPFELHNLPSFPTETLPSWLRSFVEALAESTQTPPDMAAMMSLSVLATALAGKAMIVLKKDWVEPLNIWTITAMEPANRKSAVVRELMAPVATYQREEAKRLAPAIREANEMLRTIEAQIERLRSHAAKARGEEEREHIMKKTLSLSDQAATIQVPVSPRLWTDDCTPEMMATLLTTHDGRMAVISAEGTILIEILAGRYSKGVRPNMGIYLAGHAGDAYQVDRRGRPSEHLSHPAITIGVTVQKEVLRSMASYTGFRGCGLLARFLYCIPESRLGRRKTDSDPVPEWMSDNYQTHVRVLLELPFNTDKNGDKCPHAVHLTGGARDVLRTIQNDVEPQLAPFEELGFINDWAGKLCGAVGRIAAILHAADLAPHHQPWDKPVPPETMERAVKVGWYLVEHAKAAFTEMQCGTSSLLEDAAVVLKTIKSRGVATFSERDLHQALRGRARFKQAESLQPVLDMLVEHRYVRRKKVERTTAGRQSTVISVNPAFLAPPSILRMI